MNASGLGAAPASALRRIQRGSTQILWAIGSLPLGFALSMFWHGVVTDIVDRQKSGALGDLCEGVGVAFTLAAPLVPAALLALGTFAITTRLTEISPHLDCPALRWLARFTSLGVAVALATLVLTFTLPTLPAVGAISGTSLAVTALGSWAACACFVTLYIRRLALFDHHDELVREAHRCARALPMLYTVGILLAGVGPLLGIAFHAQMCIQVRRMVARAAQLAG